MSKRIELTSEENVTVVTFKDHRLVDEIIIHELSAELAQVVSSREHANVLFNFEEVSFLSTMVLGQLTIIKKAARVAKTNIKLCSIQPFIYEVFLLVSFDKLFDIYPTKDAAMRAFRGEH